MVGQGMSLILSIFSFSYALKIRNSLYSFAAVKRPNVPSKQMVARSSRVARSGFSASRCGIS
jgi:hypothetical protein